MKTFGIQKLVRRFADAPSPADVSSVVNASPYGTLVTALNALVFTVAQWGSLGGAELAIWCASTVALCAAVFSRSRRAGKTVVEHVSKRAAKRLVFMSVLMALPWAVLAAVFLPVGRDFDQLVTLIVCVGMYTGAAMMLHRTVAAMMAFVAVVNLGVIFGGIVTWPSDALVLVLYDLISASFVCAFAFVAGETARERDRMLTRLSDTNRELEAANRKVSSFAYVDALTGLPNRKAFSEAIERDFEEAGPGELRYAVLMFDLDNFKNVNDSLGHHAGDELLSVTGKRIAAMLDPECFVARLGGDEFAVLAPLDDAHDPERLAADLIRTVTEPVEIGGRRVVPGTSVGIAVLPDHADSTSELLKHADAALRRAKEMGKGRTVLFDSELRESLDKAGLVALELKRALDADEFSVHYQPKFDLESGAACGVEALVRWFHPVLGQLTPDYFLPIAAERATMQRLSSFIFNRVAEDVLAWREADVDVGKVAVNIHPVELKAPDHLMKLIASLADRGIGPGDIMLEITEACFVGRGTEDAPRILREISDRGYELSLDDFGTGHAALSHLRSIPVREIKIDRSFVSPVTETRSAKAFISAFIAIADGMRLRTVAEGVETRDHLDTLSGLGVAVGQGYYWSPPLPPAELAAFLLARNGPGNSGGGLGDTLEFLDKPGKTARSS